MTGQRNIKKPVVIPQETFDFLMEITKPASLKHTASHADFIRNNTLEEIRRIVCYVNDKGYY